MANPLSKLFYFYRRYKWRASDFTLLQQSLVEAARGPMEGAFGGAVLSGMDVTNTNLTLNIAAGISVGPTGFLGVFSSVQNVLAVAPTGSNPCRSLLVVRPNPTDGDNITRPTSPFESVPLTQTQAAQVAIIQGTAAANPAYPAKGANDVILCGLRLAPGQVTFAAEDLDFEVREIPGVNGKTKQHTLRYDDRLRPYRASALTVGIKPSQTSGSAPLSLLYPARATPSLYPKTAGTFTASDAILNFSTGGVSGGDGTSSAFTPTVATGANALVATLCLERDDTIKVLFGTQGTLAQCMAAIRNQTYSGAGSINPGLGRYKLAYVVLISAAGALQDLMVVDARGSAIIGEAVTGSTGTPVGVTAGGGITPLGVERETIFVNTAAGNVVVTANPRIAAGKAVGDRVRLVGTSDANYPTLNDGNGLWLNGAIDLQNHQIIDLMWDGTLWTEEGRS